MLAGGRARILLLSGFLSLCSSAHAGFLTHWIGYAGDSLWTNPTNWDRLAVPGLQDDVIIDLPGSNVVVLNTNTTISSLTLGGAQGVAVLELAGVSLQCNESSVINTNGILDITADSSLEGPGPFQFLGTIRVPVSLGLRSLALNCIFTNYGSIDAETNSEFNLLINDSLGISSFFEGTIFDGAGIIRFPAGFANFQCSGTMTVNGTLELQTDEFMIGAPVWTGPGLLRWSGGTMSDFTFAPDFHVEISGQGNADGACTNNGTIRWLADTTLYYFDFGFFNYGLFQIEGDCDLEGGGFQNSGTIRVPAGLGTRSLTLDCDFTNSGTIYVETNSELNVQSTSGLLPTFDDGTVFDGPGTVRLFAAHGDFGCFGTITVNDTIKFERSVGVFILGRSTWTGPGLLRWLGGGLGGVSFAPDFHVEISGPDSKFIVENCTNNGSVRWLGGGGLNIGSSGAGGFFNNSVFQIEGDCILEGGGFQNFGTIRVPSGLGTQSLGLYCNFANSGAVDVETNSVLNLQATNSFVPTFFDGSVFEGPGIVRLMSGSSGIECFGAMTVNGTIEQQGDVYMQGAWTGSGLFRWMSGSALGSTFAPDFHVEISGPDTKYIYQSCTNRGTIRWLGSGTLDLGTFGGGTLYNEGLFELDADCSMDVAAGGGPGGFQNSGIISVPAGLGTRLLMPNCNFINSGTFDVESNSALNFPGTNNFTPSFLDGTVFGGPGIVRFSALDLDIGCFGTMTVNGTVEFQPQGQYGQATWTGPGLLRWLKGRMRNFTFAPDFHVEISGADQKLLVGTCTNLGTTRWLGGGKLSAYFPQDQFHNGGLLQIEADGLWDGLPLNNEPSGVFRQITGDFSVPAFTNRGTVKVEKGKLDVAGEFFSDVNSSYQVNLSSNTPITGYHQLNAQNLALSGSLQLSLTNSFSPTNGSSFAIASDLSQSGRFSGASLPVLQSNLTWHVRYSPTSVVLEVVPPFALKEMSYTNGQFQFSLNGYAAGSYDIQVSTNLTDWTTIQTNNPFPGNVTFTDTNVAGFDHLFYRGRIFE